MWCRIRHLLSVLRLTYHDVNRSGLTAMSDQQPDRSHPVIIHMYKKSESVKNWFLSMVQQLVEAPSVAGCCSNASLVFWMMLSYMVVEEFCSALLSIVASVHGGCSIGFRRSLKVPPQHFCQFEIWIWTGSYQDLDYYLFQLKICCSCMVAMAALQIFEILWYPQELTVHSMTAVSRSSSSLHLCVDKGSCSRSLVVSSDAALSCCHVLLREKRLSTATLPD